MPEYALQLPETGTAPVDQPVFYVPACDDSALGADDVLDVDVSTLKHEFANALGASLIGAPDLYDPTRVRLAALADALAPHDPEFILKLALFTRNHLNIRTPANFLLALAAAYHGLRSCCNLAPPDRVLRFAQAPQEVLLRLHQPAVCPCHSPPALTVSFRSDWIEVAQLYQSMHESAEHFGTPP